MLIKTSPFMSGHIESKTLLPFVSHFIEVNGYHMHYLDEGTGPAVLALHGNPTWCYYYRHLVTALRDQYRVIVPDHLGCGLSERHPDKHFRARDRADHLNTLIESLKIDRFSLIMHDWGGPIGTYMALKRLNNLDKLVYLNTTMTEIQSLPQFIRAAAHPIIGKFLTQYSRHFLRWTCQMGSNKGLANESIQGYMYPYLSAQDRSAIWGFVEDIPFSPHHPTFNDMMILEEGLPKLNKTPIQVIWGLKDLCFHPTMLRKLLRHFPHAEVLEIAEASHLVLEDAPALVCQTIKNFLREPHFSKSPIFSVVTNNATEPQMGASALYEAFREIVEQTPDHDAVILPKFTRKAVSYSHFSFQWLNACINRYRRGLHQLGLDSGDKVLFLVPPGLDFLALVYAVMAEGAVPVFIDPGIKKAHLFECLEDIQPDVFIGSPKAQVLRFMKKKAFQNVKFFLTASTWSLFPGPTLSNFTKFDSTPLSNGGKSDKALILFTSGATGRPKGVLYHQENIIAQLTIFKNCFGIEKGAKDVPLLPIFSVFNLALGVGSALPPINHSCPLSLDPSHIVRLIDDLHINYSFGSPTLWKKIAHFCAQNHKTLPSLKKVFMAGAPVPNETLELVRKVLKNGVAYTPYGATEALPVTLGPCAEIQGNISKYAIAGGLGTFVGKPVEGIALRIIKPVNGPISHINDTVDLPPLTIGEVIVQGQNVSQSYYRRPDAERAGKIHGDTFVWHRMGDMGYIDNDGGLYFCGRKAHIVKSDKTYFPIPIERVFNTHPKVNRSALISRFDSKPAIAIEPNSQWWPRSIQQQKEFGKELRELAKKDKLTADIQEIYFFKAFPVDNRHNAKIYRDTLSDWAKKEGHGY